MAQSQKTYEEKPTANKDLFRMVDREGNWIHYYHKPSKRYLRAVSYILDHGYPIGYGLREYLKKTPKEESERVLKETGERGDRIHQAIGTAIEMAGFALTREQIVVLDENNREVALANSEWDALLSFEQFWNRHEAEASHSEFSVFNLKEGYAGTLDGRLRLNKNCGVKTCQCDLFIGKVGGYDWKSGGGIYDRHRAQVAAYFKTDNAPPVDYTAVLRVGTNHKTTGGYQVEFYNGKKTSQHYREFLAAKLIHDGSYKPFEETEIVEIPGKVKLILKKPKKKVVTKKATKKTKKDGSSRKSSRKTGGKAKTSSRSRKST